MEHLEDPASTIPTTDDEAGVAAAEETPGESDAAWTPRERPVLYGVKPEEAAAGIEVFDDLPMHDKIRDAVRKIGWEKPTPVQKLCLPYTLRGRDVAGFAQTGTGKTAVFLMTIVNKLLQAQPAPDVAPTTRAVVLAPTRELAMQIEQDAELMLGHAGLTSLVVIGGIDYDKQARRLKEGVDVVFATPGRLKDYVQKKLIDLGKIEVFVCDEADRMFDMGFIEDVEFFLERIPETAQKLLFSATTNEEVKELAFEYLESPEYISVNPEVITPEKIEQHAFHCHATQKLKVMLGLLREHNPECSIVFTNTKLTAEWLHYKLEHNGIEADLITGDLPQSKRIRLIQRIKEGKLKALIATDVASRGLHISRVTHVYNFDLPDDPANYVHRIGRTARAGAQGFAYSLVCDDYGQNLTGINELLGSTLRLQTEWPKDEYLTIEDKAGNPFEERYAQRARAASGDYGRGPRRDGPSGDRGRGPRRDDGRAGGESTGSRSDRSRRPSRDGAGEASQQGRRGPAPEQGRRGERQHGGEGRAAGGQQGGRGSSRGKDQRQGRGRRDEGRQDRNGAQASWHGQDKQSRAAMVPQTKVEEAAPKTFGAMIKRLFKALFGWGK